MAAERAGRASNALSRLGAVVALASLGLCVALTVDFRLVGWKLLLPAVKALLGCSPGVPATQGAVAVLGFVGEHARDACLLLAAAAGGVTLGYRALLALQPDGREPPPARPSVSRAEAALVAAAAAWYLAMAAGGMARGFGYDELFTVVRFVDAPTALDTMTRSQAFNNHVAYSLAARGCRSLLGRDEWVVRLPALLLGLACVPAAWALARTLFGRRVAVAAAFGCAASPSLVLFGQSARGYTGLALCALLSTSWFIALLAKPSPGLVAAVVVVGALGTWLHPCGVFVTAALGVALAVAGATERPGVAAVRQGAWAVLLAGALGVALHVPLLPSLAPDLAARGQGTFQPAFPWEVARMAAGTGSATVDALLVGLAGFAWWRSRREAPTAAAWCAAGLLLPLLALWLARPLDLYPRLAMSVVPFFVVYAARGLAAFAGPGRGARSRRLAAAAAGLALLATWSLRSVGGAPDEGFRAAAAALERGAPPGTTLCAVGGGAELLATYVARPLVVPGTLAELRALAGPGRSARCLVRRCPWSSVEHRRAEEWLAGRPADQDLGVFAVYQVEGR